MDRKKLGRLGEEIAQKYLVSLGYIIVEKNYRCSLGEIDVIAWQNSELVFIEIKTRTNNLYGTPADSINRAKQKRLYRLASYYLQVKRFREVACRFDVVLLQMDRDYQLKEIELISQAF